MLCFRGKYAHKVNVSHPLHSYHICYCLECTHAVNTLNSTKFHPATIHCLVSIVMPIYTCI